MVHVGQLGQSGIGHAWRNTCIKHGAGRIPCGLQRTRHHSEGRTHHEMRDVWGGLNSPRLITAHGQLWTASPIRLQRGRNSCFPTNLNCTMRMSCKYPTRSHSSSARASSSRRSPGNFRQGPSWGGITLLRSSSCSGYPPASET